MDDRRFDSLVKAFASARNRRTVLKGLLGLGGAAVTGSVLPDETEAARAGFSGPPPPPSLSFTTCTLPLKKCGTTCINPNTQSCCNNAPCPLGRCNTNPNPDICCAAGVPCHNGCCTAANPVCCGRTCCPAGSACTTTGLCCAPGNQVCGAECCPTNATCCDRECCLFPNDCVSEELCCPRLPTEGCETPAGDCCATLCLPTPGGLECCPDADFCPGGAESPDRCCQGETPILCDCGTDGNICLPDTDAACCIDADCDTPPPGSSECVIADCVDHVCVYTDCASHSICCPDNLGTFACRISAGDECCLTPATCDGDCEACVDFVCVDDPNTFPCGPPDDPDKFCCDNDFYSICCGPTQFECCGFDDDEGVTRVCNGDGKCCEAGQVVCKNADKVPVDCCPSEDGCNPTTGVCCPAETPYFCVGNDTCCAAPCIVFGEVEYCCPPGRGRVCPANPEFFCCPNGQQCTDDGDCCPVGSNACGDRCCPLDSNVCCEITAPLPVPTEPDCCPTVEQCNVDGRCCRDEFTVCGANCCVPDSDIPQCCNGACVPADVECCNDDDNPCDGECEVCDNGQCVGDCLDCQSCRFNPETNTGACVNVCDSCAVCQSTEAFPNGTCVPSLEGCLDCQVCFIDDETGQRFCGGDLCSGCGVCRSTGQFPNGACVPNDEQCLTCQHCEVDANGAGRCVDDCDGCAVCRSSGPGVQGACVPDNSQCPTCQLCQINAEGTGGSCVDNCPAGEICCAQGNIGDCCPAAQCVGGVCEDPAIPLTSAVTISTEDCIPASCEEINACGSDVDAGCGVVIDCPACPCVPTDTCASLGACGEGHVDDCGNALSCPPCPEPAAEPAPACLESGPCTSGSECCSGCCPSDIGQCLEPDVCRAIEKFAAAED